MDESKVGNLGERIFRFVVVADTHVNPEDGKSSSPFAVNSHANERAGAAVADINRWMPALVVHLGDLVHPVPELPSFEPACERFKTLVRDIRAPLYLLSGNHDVGDKRVDWMPAGTVTQEAV
ncbi:MAG TPA: metallophosphoesterase, partial [Burkholderiales bacterium]|nr:metallophosphoesterase [Burkholderiales bacterium]